MSKLRPECHTTPGRPGLSGTAALEKIRSAVARRRSLIHGMLDDDTGKHCAMGCLWDDSPSLSIQTDVVDRVAAVNDAHPLAAPHERWKRVMQWLNYELGL